MIYSEVPPPWTVKYLEIIIRAFTCKSKPYGCRLRKVYALYLNLAVFHWRWTQCAQSLRTNHFARYTNYRFLCNTRAHVLFNRIEIDVRPFVVTTRPCTFLLFIFFSKTLANIYFFRSSFAYYRSNDRTSRVGKLFIRGINFFHFVWLQ